jgi:transcription-repair coupling factor (superfamily II helicase)
MHTVLQRLGKIERFQKAVAAYSSPGQIPLAIHGLSGPARSALTALAALSAEAPLLLVGVSGEVLEIYRNDLTLLCPERPILQLPVGDPASVHALARSQELARQRTETLTRLSAGEPIIVLATVEAFALKTPAPQLFYELRCSLRLGETIDKEQLLSRLIQFGYERVDRVDSVGYFSSRGGIIDVYPVNLAMPVRIELFGDSVDSVREFNPLTQRSVKTLPAVTLFPSMDSEEIAADHAMISYLPSGAGIVFDEPVRLEEALNNIRQSDAVSSERTVDWDRLKKQAQTETRTCWLSQLPYALDSETAEAQSGIVTRGIPPYHRKSEFLLNDIRSWQERRYQILLMMSSLQSATVLRENLIQQGITAQALIPADTMTGPGVYVVQGNLSAGFELPEERLAVITEKEIKGRLKLQRHSRSGQARRIADYTDLKAGDHVVHVGHGIGKYIGVETIELNGFHRDYFHIRYAADDKLYVPTDQVQLLQKYIGSEGDAPKLSRLGGTDWARAKSRAKAAVADLARELLELYARRSITPGFAFLPDTPWQVEFEDAFPFEETPDQLSAIAEIKADMEKPLAMDRLLCGDVGFGKTEVALRAAFKAVMSGKQVAVLVPTTVLAQQHFQTFSSRFAAYGLAVDVVSRFKTPAEQRNTLQLAAEGKLDVLIGTHRLLQPDVAFKNLGLLVVDEEQRFGVAQKERLKRWSTGLDVLTLTATPIPRTLHMSLAGLRDMSSIESAPEDRLPVQTYVVEYQPELIAEAIKQELGRGGQVYFVYNRIETIEKMHAELKSLVPEAKIGVGHGKMPDDSLEDVMFDFYEGHYNLLLCTSIIENGLDVANANTIIVYDSDHFGLSQLYQMRGRVGRSDRLAHAWLTYRPKKVISEIAEKRLRAIMEFTELGAGFKIAMRDLEIRGAGNLLGSQQHGHIVGVGFEMYCRLLEEAIRTLRDGPQAEPKPDPLIELQIDAYIPNDYVEDAMHKIELYQQIAAIRTEAQVSDLHDAMIDRFGDPPEALNNLMTVAKLRNIGRLMGVKSIVEKTDWLEISFTDQPDVNVQGLMELRARLPGKIKVIAGPPQMIWVKKPQDRKESFGKWMLSLFQALDPGAAP